MPFELAIRAVKDGKDQIIPAAVTSAICYTFLCQAIQANGPARRMENPHDQMRLLATAPLPPFIYMNFRSLLRRWWRAEEVPNPAEQIQKFWGL